MADLGFLPGVKRIMDKTPAQGPAAAVLRDARRRRRRARQPLPDEPGRAQRRHRAVAGVDDDPPRAARGPQRPPRRDRRPGRRAGPDRGVHPHQARRQGAGPPAQRSAACPRSSCTATCRRTPAPATLDAFSAGTATTLVATDIAARGIHVDDVGLVVHADPPIGAQGVPAPLRAYGARRRRGHGRHRHGRRPAGRRTRPHPQGRHQAHHHEGHGGPPAPRRRSRRGSGRCSRRSRWSRSPPRRARRVVAARRRPAVAVATAAVAPVPAGAAPARASSAFPRQGLGRTYVVRLDRLVVGRADAQGTRRQQQRLALAQRRVVLGGPLALRLFIRVG